MEQNRSVTEVFDKGTAEGYDDRNKHFAPISENLHFLIPLVLKGLPENATILCVGAGTGIEIQKLAALHKNWKFVAVEPSIKMLEGCKARIEKNNLSARCELFHGYLSDYPHGKTFDAALCLLVAHFITDLDQRQNLFKDIAGRLNQGGYFINAEISYDTSSPDYNNIIEKWKAMHALSGATEEHLVNMVNMMREMLLLLPPAQTKSLITSAGFEAPIQFFQSLLIHGWYAKKL